MPPIAEHKSQSGKDAPKKTTEGAGEHPVSVPMVVNTTIIRQNDERLPVSLFIFIYMKHESNFSKLEYAF
ncbi:MULTISPECIES: hypothetical protein [Citrobacter]|uniref:hypothetical protein n=1 Tax=Citrobacter TaxID=544 RepID=UPI001CE35FC5|nr:MULTISPECIES: hypothetical protein [Citrobacter]MCM8844046.1 hypothetical protein [Citrobacter cronae]GJL38342.1 hypothetical protein TUM17576_51620 [Enterobacter hormaechei]GJL43668.1 hypothetical protein TUM17577_48770 [Enterobacter asburiae]